MGHPARPVIERVSEKYVVNPETGCWEWIGQINAYGYGKISIGSKTDGTAFKAMAHRVAYELLVGPIPDGLDLDHLCRNRRCINPAHLEPVTRQVNLLRGETLPARNAAKTHCVRGHELAGDNVIHQKTGKRWCRECRRAHDRKRRPAKIPTSSERTHCPSGHEYAGSNLMFTKQGHRKCRECVKLQNKRQRERRLASARRTA